MDGYIPFAPHWQRDDIIHITCDETSGIRFTHDTIIRVVGVGDQALTCLQLMSQLKFVDLIAISSSCLKLGLKPEVLSVSNKIVEHVKKTVLGTDIGIIITALEDDAEAQLSIKLAQIMRATTGALTLAFVIKSPTDAPAGIAQLKEAVDTLFVCEEEQLPPPSGQHHDKAIQYAILDAVSALVCDQNAEGFINLDISDYLPVLKPWGWGYQGPGRFGRIGQGMGQGEHFFEDAMHHAMQGLRLAPSVIKSASAILVSARCNRNFPIAKWEKINLVAQEYLNEEADVKYSILFDNNMAEDQICTTIFLTWPDEGCAVAKQPADYRNIELMISRHILRSKRRVMLHARRIARSGRNALAGAQKRRARAVSRTAGQ